MANIKWLRQAAKAAEVAAAEAERASDAALEAYMASSTDADIEVARRLNREAREAYQAMLDARHSLRQAELGY